MAVDVVEARRPARREADESQWVHCMSTGAGEAAAFWAGVRNAVALSAAMWLALAAVVLVLRG